MGERIRSYKLPHDEIYNVVLEALRLCSFKIEETSRNFIRASAGMSLLSWGESIELTLTSKRAETQILAASTPAFQFIDWGKSSDDLDKFFTILDKLIHSRT